jgi:hypothetical protein
MEGALVFVVQKCKRYSDGGSDTDLVIQAHQQLASNIFIRFRSDSLRFLHSSAIIESPNLCQTRLVPKFTHLTRIMRKKVQLLVLSSTGRSRHCCITLACRG